MKKELRKDKPGKGRGGRIVVERGRPIEERYCLGVPEAARMLGLSRNFGYELVKRGELPVVRFGKRLLIPKIALEKMLLEGVTVNNARRE
jgi:excisionase family DNA binding protein